jgi:hypothetical protein
MAEAAHRDNETWAGNTHPAQALHGYRRTIGDPHDKGVLHVVDMDTSLPRPRLFGLEAGALMLLPSPICY